ncbi:hypothetical protein TNCT_325981 [Trichonephila clavata]|uniref:Uncharacterized protein n=1 Tax=Trichonephila clavata TaxID=2740835 RepID=A0A8X6LTE3_TRICU|nr:hypothetical protein TNCT_325981 [Trichonephila clavata]
MQRSPSSTQIRSVAPDELPQTLSSYSCFVDLDSKRKPGSHWVAIAFETIHVIIFVVTAQSNNNNILHFIKIIPIIANGISIDINALCLADLWSICSISCTIAKHP